MMTDRIYVMQRLTSHDDDLGRPNRIITICDETGWMVVVVDEGFDGREAAVEEARDQLVRRGLIDSSTNYRLLDMGNLEVRPGILARMRRRDRETLASGMLTRPRTRGHPTYR